MVVSRTFTDYYKRSKKNLKYMRDRLQKFQSERTDLMNKNTYEVGQNVYMYQVKGSVILMGSRKWSVFFGTSSNIQGHRAKSVPVDVIDWANLSHLIEERD